MTTPNETRQTSGNGITERERIIDRNRTRNLACSIANESLWGMAMAFVHSATILPIFLEAMGATRLEIALIPAVTGFTYSIPQLLFSRYTAHVDRKRVLLVILHAPSILGFVTLYVAFTYLHLPRSAQVAVFFAAYLVFTLGMGAVIPVWADYLTRITSVRWRGRYLGITFMMHSTWMILGAYAAKRLIDGYGFPHGFAIGFLAAACLGAIGAIPFLFSQEAPTTEPRELVSWRVFVSELVSILRTDRNLMRYFIARTFLMSGLIGLAFFAVYAQKITGFELGEVGVLAMVVVAAEALSAYCWGRVGDRRGYRWVLVGVNAILLIACVGVMSCRAMPTFYVIFVAMGVYRGAEWLAHMNLIFELCPTEEKSIYFSLASSMLALPTIGLPVLGGKIAEWWGYPAAFWTSAGGMMIGMLLLIFWVRDPRHPR